VGGVGYDVFERVFDAGETRSLVDELVRAGTPRTRAGARHVLSVAAVAELASDSRLIELAVRFVGAGARPFRATFFDKSPAANWLIAWHQDTALPLTTRVADSEWGPWSVKHGVLYAHAPASALEQVIALRVHLDDSTLENGPLRVLPGTHDRGVLSDAEIEQLAREIEAVACIARAGGVVAMRPLIVHASSKSADANPRRVLHIEYAAALTLAPSVELAVV
jgi:hypothetical protein